MAATMTIEQRIATKLEAEFRPEHLDVRNESGMHNVPPGSESHFRLLVVSSRFAGVSRLERHRRINSVLGEEIDGPVHALAVDAFTPEEWQARSGKAGESPPCRGGSKA